MFTILLVIMVSMHGLLIPKYPRPLTRVSFCYIHLIGPSPHPHLTPDPLT